MDRRRRTRWNGVVAIVSGVVFALEAILNAPGTAFAVTAVVLGGIYALLATLSR
ncbi:MAG: hypothetical protein ACR2NB_01215 [Solirubrobacteraceae bacterium]